MINIFKEIDKLKVVKIIFWSVFWMGNLLLVIGMSSGILLRSGLRELNSSSPLWLFMASSIYLSIASMPFVFVVNIFSGLYVIMKKNIIFKDLKNKKYYCIVGIVSFLMTIIILFVSHDAGGLWYILCETIEYCWKKLFWIIDDLLS